MATSNNINANSTGLATYNGSGTWAGRTITAGNTSVSVSNGNGVSGNPTISVTGSGFPWTDVTSSTQQMAVNNGYVTNLSGGVTYTLPSTAAEGDMVWVVGKLGAWTIAENSSQQILFGSSSSTATSGTLASTNVGDCALLLCTTANTIFRVVNAVGNLTIS